MGIFEGEKFLLFVVGEDTIKIFTHKSYVALLQLLISFWHEPWIFSSWLIQILSSMKNFPLENTLYACIVLWYSDIITLTCMDKPSWQLPQQFSCQPFLGTLLHCWHSESLQLRNRHKSCKRVVFIKTIHALLIHLVYSWMCVCGGGGGGSNSSHITDILHYILCLL